MSPFHRPPEFKEPVTSPSKYCFGLKKSIQKEDDKVSLFHYSFKELPSQFDLRDIYHIKAYNQGSTNSCSANAICNQINVILQELKLKIIPSRSFLHFNSRLVDRENEKSFKPISDDGATLLSSYKSIERFKISDDEYHPFNEMTINEFPSPQAYINGFSNDIVTSYR